MPWVEHERRGEPPVSDGRGAGTRLGQQTHRNTRRIIAGWVVCVVVLTLAPIATSAGSDTLTTCLDPCHSAPGIIGPDVATTYMGDATNAGHAMPWDPRVVDDASGATLPQGARMPCDECHVLHGQDGGSIYMFSTERTGEPVTTVRQLCVGCHRPSDSLAPAPLVCGLVLKKLPAGAPDHAEDSSRPCSDCHGSTGHAPAPHGGDGDCGEAACHGGTGSHPIHLSSSDPRGPGAMECDACHDTAAFPSFAGGVDEDGNGSIGLAETDACDPCHSPGGGYNGVESTTSPSGAVSVGAKDSWETGVYETTSSLQPGKDRWCAGCHDGDPDLPGELPALIAGVFAPPIAGDEGADATYGSGYGFYLTGHGLATDAALPSSGGVSLGAGLGCGDCHDFEKTHIDGDPQTFAAEDPAHYRDGFRLVQVDLGSGLVDPMTLPWPQTTPTAPERFALCSSCHDPDPYLGVNDNTNLTYVGSNYHAYHIGMSNIRFDSDWNGANESRISCVTCHNVHGSRRLAMVRDGTLVDREPGIALWYKNDDLVSYTQMNPDPPTPESLPLIDSTGIIVHEVTTGNVCSTCHTHNWTTGYERDALWWDGSVPAVGWTWEEHYQGRGIHTDRLMNATDDVFFRIKYFDPDNDPPASIEVWVDENDNGTYEAGEKWAMAAASADTTYTDGAIYTATLTLTDPGDGTVTYRVDATDGANEAVGPASHDNVIEWDANGTRDVPSEYGSIQEAMDAAYDGNVIVVSDGTYAENIDFGGKDIVVQSAGGSSETTLTGSGAIAPTVRFTNGETSAVIDGFTITNTGPDDEPVRGVLIGDQATPTIRNCDIVSNRADTNAYGGGIKITGGGMTLEGSNVTGNWARRGGGIYAENSTQTITVTDCLIEGNDSLEAGGGVYLDSIETTTTFTSTSISGNASGTHGGGIYAADSPIELIDCTVDDNIGGNAGGEHGGGIYLAGPQAAASITGCTLDGNATVGSGGGLYLNGSAQSEPLTIESTSISNNSASVGRGGGVYLTGCLYPAVFTDVTISGNTSNASGGGISAECSVVITGSTVSANTVTHTPENGGGIYVAGATSDLTIVDTSVDGNQCNRGSGVYFDGATLSITGGTINDNTGVGQYDGGGLWTGDTTTIYGTYILGNSCGYSGGGVFHSTTGTLTMTNCTVGGNRSGTYYWARGGGVRGGSGFTMNACTVAGNYGRDAGGVHGGGGTITNSIVWGNVTGGSIPNIDSATVSYTDTSGGGWTDGGNNVSGDPALVDLQSATSSSSTSAGDYHLTAGSLCIAAADSSTSPADDIDGDVRPQGIGDDMGSDEYAGAGAMALPGVKAPFSALRSRDEPTLSMQWTAAQTVTSPDTLASQQAEARSISVSPDISGTRLSPLSNSGPLPDPKAKGESSELHASRAPETSPSPAVPLAVGTASMIGLAVRWLALRVP